MINMGRRPCNHDRLDFSEHETRDVRREDCDMFSRTLGLFSFNSVSLFPENVYLHLKFSSSMQVNPFCGLFAAFLHLLSSVCVYVICWEYISVCPFRPYLWKEPCQIGDQSALTS